jgi:hypothetical protein
LNWDVRVAGPTRVAYLDPGDDLASWYGNHPTWMSGSEYSNDQRNHARPYNRERKFTDEIKAGDFQKWSEALLGAGARVRQSWSIAGFLLAVEASRGPFWQARLRPGYRW